MAGSIKEMERKIKGVEEKAHTLLGHREITLSILMILVALVSFELGYLSHTEAESSFSVLPPLTRELAEGVPHMALRQLLSALWELFRARMWPPKTAQNTTIHGAPVPNA